MSEYVYRAYMVGRGTWMVKRWKASGPSDIGYAEALIWVDTTDPAVAIQAAIDRGSWA